MNIRRLGPLVVSIALVMGGATACGKVADKVGEKAGEKVTEKAIEQASGGKAKVDVDGEGKGSFSVKNDDGTESKIEFGSKKLPEGWPKFLALPGGFEIVTASSMGSGSDGTYLSVMANGSGDAEAIMANFKSALTTAGFEKVSENSMSVDGDTTQSYAATKGEQTATVTVADRAEPDDPKLPLTLSITVISESPEK